MASDPSTPPERGRRKRREAREFLQLAAQLLRPAPAGRVIGIGGVIASGKSTLAARLAARIGAAVVSADLTRKQLAGIGLGQAGDPAIYGPEFTERTQTELLRRARQVLQAGRTVILDTTFRSAALRRRVRRLADRSGVPFLMVEVRVPEGVARQRLRERVSGVSDAREELYEAFMRSYQPMSELEGDEHLSVDGTGDPAATVDRLVGRLKASGSQSERK